MDRLIIGTGAPVTMITEVKAKKMLENNFTAIPSDRKFTGINDLPVICKGRKLVNNVYHGRTSQEWVCIQEKRDDEGAIGYRWMKKLGFRLADHTDKRRNLTFRKKARLLTPNMNF